MGEEFPEMEASKSINKHAQCVQEALGTLFVACSEFVTVPSGLQDR